MKNKSAAPSVAGLQASPQNPRKISEEQLKRLAKAMAEYGDLSGIIVNRTTGHLVGGHQRVKVFDPTWKIVKRPATDATGTVASGHVESPWGTWSYREVEWPEKKERAANIAANKHGGGWDFKLLTEQLMEMDDGSFDMDLVGFTEEELRKLIGEKPETGEDDVPGIPAKPIAKIGELWVMGDHHLFVGDCTKPDSWKKLMGGKKASCIVTDPPYGVSYESKSGKFDVIEGDHKRGDDLLKMLSSSMKMMENAADDDAAFYIFHASSTREDFATAIKSAGLVEKQYLIWAKTGVVLGHSDYRWSHEPFFYASKDGHKPKFYGDRANPTVWRVSMSSKKSIATVIGPGLIICDGKGSMVYVMPKAPKGKKVRSIRLVEGQDAMVDNSSEGSGTVWEFGREQDYSHPTQKPVALIQRAIENSSAIEQIIVDPFLGSGTTLIAAEKTDRICYGMELDPKYASVIIKRWEEFTGKKATRKSGG